MKIADKTQLADLIKNKAEDIAKKVDDERIKRDRDGKKKFKFGKPEYDETKNKITQIRLFYDELQKLQRRVNENGANSFPSFLPEVYLVGSKAAYSAGRKLITKTLIEFLKENICDIENKEHLDNFMLYFEAFLGYYRYFNPKES